MSNAQEVRSLLRRFGLRPYKRLGQNYLHDAQSLQQVVRAADLAPDDRVLEVGAGIANLTLALAKVAAKVWAVEVDRRFLPLLQEALLHVPNVELIMGDALALNYNHLIQGDPFVVVGNIPYQISSALLRQFLEMQRPPQRIVFTVQEEVADRIVAPPGKLSLLAVSVLAYGDPRKLDKIPAESFYPVPAVDSAVLRIDIHDKPSIGPGEVADFFRIVKAGFGQRRKQLRNSLAGGLQAEKIESEGWLESAGIPAEARPQELSLKEWIRLVGVIRSADRDG